MKITTLGTGTMFTLKNFHTNYLVQTSSEGYMLVDCGTDIRMALAALDISMGSIDAVYITHEHADHAGGLPYLAYHSISRYPYQKKIALYADPDLLQALWKQLEPECYIFGGFRRSLSSYFDIVTVRPHQPACWHDVTLTTWPWAHCTGFDMRVQPRHLRLAMVSHGVTLYDRDHDVRIHITGDMQPDQVPVLGSFLEQSGADLVFADCCVYGKAGDPPVHPSLADYNRLPETVKDKVRLVHYGDEVLSLDATDHPTIASNWRQEADKFGLRFATVHDTYDTTHIRRARDARKEASNVKPK